MPIPLSNIACPVLCVRDRSLCPPSEPSCPANLQLCHDLSCRPACTNAPNLCACSRMVPCDYSTKVSFSAYPHMMTGSLETACSSLLFNSSAPPSDMMWNNCTKIPELESFSPVDPLYVFQYWLLTVSMLHLGAYSLYKFLKEKVRFKLYTYS
jgi:cation-transporting ATPase 13A3/4/5